jgi:hypothetical protein
MPPVAGLLDQPGFARCGAGENPTDALHLPREENERQDHRVRRRQQCTARIGCDTEIADELPRLDGIRAPQRFARPGRGAQGRQPCKPLRERRVGVGLPSVDERRSGSVHCIMTATPRTCGCAR